MSFSSSSRGPTLPPLSTRIEEIKAMDLAPAVQHLVLLLPKLTTYLSFLGQRCIEHPSYSGTANLTELANFYLRLGTRCGREGADLETRLAHYDLYPSFQALYATSKQQLKDARVSSVANVFREFRPVCPHCVGAPHVVIPYGERRWSLQFEEDLFSELFGEQEEIGSISWYDVQTKKRKKLKTAKREWVVEALRRQKDGKLEAGEMETEVCEREEELF